MPQSCVNVQDRLSALRVCMRSKNIAATIIPTSDPHGSEYTAAHYQARCYFSGFTGSAGTLVVTLHSAALWTDSRYFIQAGQQLSDTDISLMKIGVKATPDIADWLCTQIKVSDGSINIPGDLFSEAVMRLYRIKLKAYAIDENTDVISPAWPGRPSVPSSKAFVQSTEYAGESPESKLSRIRSVLKTYNVEAVVTTALDEIAWVCNLRGTDVRFNPVNYAFMVIGLDFAYLYIDSCKVTTDVRQHLITNGIEPKEYSSFYADIPDIPAATIITDDTKTNAKIHNIIRETTKSPMRCQSPVCLMKAIKNDTQIEGVRLAMKKDGLALCRFWMKMESLVNNEADITELSLVSLLHDERTKLEGFMGESFETIVAYGAHGAVVHYEPTPETDIPVRKGKLLLIDSGAQFMHGTTDITRTYAIGEVSAEARRHSTLVLKGHIALASAVFPQGTTGVQLDILAKQFLWNEHLDFGHGTGHGVGHFLCVHEGPQNISPRGQHPLMAGMITSDEPGYYRENFYGIRHENLTLTYNRADSFLGFEVLTLCPFDLNAIDVSLLTEHEKIWLNAYHQRIFNVLSPEMNDLEQYWLKEKCKPV